MNNRDLGPLAQVQRFSFGGGISESSDPNDQDKSTGQTAGNVGVSDVMADGRGLGERLGDWVAGKFDKANLPGTIAAAGFGPLGAPIGVAVNALDSRAMANAREALTEAQFNDLMATGTPQIDSRGHSHGVGPGGINNGGRDAAGRGASAAGNNDAAAPQPPAPADPAAGATPSTRYIPGTGDYEKILIRSDGVRTNLAGQPLAYAGGGLVPGAGEEGPPSGLFAGGTPGRSDLVDAALPEGSYILPADTVSAAGEGNTEAGALSLAHRFTQSPLVKHKTVAAGPVEARVSSGEFYVSPADVKKEGGPDALDKMVKALRKHYTKHLAKLPDPKK